MSVQNGKLMNLADGKILYDDLRGRIHDIESFVEEEISSVPTLEDLQEGLATKVPKPAVEGTSGQVLRTNGDGTTFWDNDANAQDIADAVTDWLDDNVPTGQTVVVDASLLVSGAAADSQVVGAEISGLKNEIDGIKYVVTNIAPYNDSLFTTQYANTTTSDYSHDYAAVATGSSSATPRLIYTLSDYPDIDTDDIMYVSAMVYAEANEASEWEGLYRPNIFGRSMGDSSIAYGEWVNYSRRYTQTSAVGKSITFGYSYTSKTAASGKTMHLRNLVVVNLTKTYGTGKEPTIEEMDALISANDGYIETLNLFNAKQATNDIENLKSKTDVLNSNVFVDFENGFKYANPDKENDGSNYVLNGAGVSVAIDSYSRGENGDIIYTWGEFKVQSSASCESMYVAKGGNESTSIDEPDNDTWYPMSARYNRKADRTGIQFVGAWQSSASIKIFNRHLVSINLTKVFGKYNEPSRDLLDKYFYVVSQANAMDFEATNAKMLNLGSTSRELLHPAGNYVRIDEEGNVKMGSVPSPGWPGWQDIGTYGQNNTANIPIYNKVHGTIETDGMVSVLPIWGCWSDNSASTGNSHHGGHVFHGWTTDRAHRLTMVQNIYRDDEAAVFNYIPGDKSDTSEGIFLRLRLGADNNYKGVLIENEYGGTNNTDYHMARMTVYGRLNISRFNNYNNIPASADAAGVKGDICVDENYIYVCTAENTWKRIPLQAWT